MKAFAPFLCFIVLLISASARADIFRWDNGAVIPGTEGIKPGPGVQLDQLNLEYAWLGGIDLTNASFFNTNLAGASLYSSTLTAADFTGADVRMVNLAWATYSGFTSDQVYLTRSYQVGDLRGISLYGNDLSGWDFVAQDMSQTDLRRTNLLDTVTAGATFFGADLRQAMGNIDPTAHLRNAIRPNGEIQGLSLNPHETLRLSPTRCLGECSEPMIFVSQEFTVAQDATIELTTETNAKAEGFKVPLQFGESVAIALGGTLRLGVNKNSPSYDGPRTIDLFDWPNPLDQANTFDSVDVPVGTYWDLGQLYTTGEVTLLLAGDTNGDQTVDLIDLNNVRNNFGGTGLDIAGDTNADQVVDLVDLNNVRNFFGISSVAQPVPEPGSIALAGIGLLALVIARQARRSPMCCWRTAGVSRLVSSLSDRTSGLTPTVRRLAALVLLAATARQRGRLALVDCLLRGSSGTRQESSFTA